MIIIFLYNQLTQQLNQLQKPTYSEVCNQRMTYVT